mgnify:CR=1 FL=1
MTAQTPTAERPVTHHTTAPWPQARSQPQPQSQPQTTTPPRPAPTHQPRPYPEYHEATPPLIQLLQDLLSPGMQTHTLCSIHHLYPNELAAALASDELAAAMESVHRIARTRLELIKAEAEIAAWSRLTDLASNFPTNARERETSRKAAAQIMRLLQSERRASAPAITDDAPPPESGPIAPADPDAAPPPDARPGSAPNPSPNPAPEPAATQLTTQAAARIPAGAPQPSPVPADPPPGDGTPTIPTHHPETPRRRPP